MTKFTSTYSMQPKFVYLAGPILNCTKGEANDWRFQVARKLAHHNICGISPLRCEPLIGERYSADYPDPKFGTAKAIATKNKFDVAKCDLVFAYMPIVIDETTGRQKRDSIGTILEIGWARQPVVLVTDDPFLIKHPVMISSVGWCLPTIDDGIDVIVGLLAGYAGGKNV